jgi:hypothetical protein
LNGKPVTSVFGTSPLEAWGQVLTKLGLIDEIMFDTAVDSVKTSRADGFKEAKDKMEAKIRIKPRVENPPVVVEKSNVPPAVVEKSDDRPVVVEKSDGLPVVDGAVSPVPSSVNEDRGKEEKKIAFSLLLSLTPEFVCLVISSAIRSTMTTHLASRSYLRGLSLQSEKKRPEWAVLATRKKLSRQWIFSRGTTLSTTLTLRLSLKAFLVVNTVPRTCIKHSAPQGHLA